MKFLRIENNTAIFVVSEYISPTKRVELTAEHVIRRFNKRSGKKDIFSQELAAEYEKAINAFEKSEVQNEQIRRR